MIAHITFIWEQEPRPVRLNELELCVRKASRFYEIRIHTNLTNLPYDGIVPRKFASARPWSVHKLRTFLDAPIGEPYIHLDSDTFLDRPLPDKLINAPLFAQNPESIRHYGRIAEMPPEWREKFILPIGSFRAFNMGVFGGDPEMVAHYARFALESASNCPWHTPATWVEQAPLARFAKDWGLEVATLLPSTRASKPWYVHLMTRKDDPKWIDWVNSQLGLYTGRTQTP